MRNQRTLSENLLFWRCDHPDEWSMDEFIRDAEKLEQQQNEILGTLETLVKECLNDAEGCPNIVTLADSVELIKRLKEK